VASADGLDKYTQVNLTSDLPGVATNQDLNLVNPWGLVASSTTPFWTADNGTGLSTIYPGSGKPAGLVVTIPPAPGSGATADPTGIVFNTGGASTFGGSMFIFVTESGSIAGWSGGTNAVTEATGVSGSIYKGLGINSAGTMLYAANFGTNHIDVFDSSFHAVSLGATAFKDPTLPSGYAPFNIQNIGGQLVVAYAASNGGEDEVDGPTLGYISVFDSNGNFIKRLVSNGPLNAPWGLALAPSTGFGALSGDLLVGNFGDGKINAFNPNTGAFMGTLDDGNGNPIVIPGLWGIDFGNGAQGTSTTSLYFNAGIPTPGDTDVEAHGLFGSLTPVPEPGSFALGGLALLLAATVRRTLKRRP
jgi:uncharacterized protein (TIGR03118 family)